MLEARQKTVTVKLEARGARPLSRTNVCPPQEVEASTLRVFNILAEPAPVVAEWAVPRIRGSASFPVHKGKELSMATYPRFLTATGAILRFVTSPLWSSNKHIDVSTGKLRQAWAGSPAAVKVAASPKKSE